MTQSVVLRKYPHRRLYDASRRRFVKLSEISELVKGGATVSVRDSSDRDVTAAVLSQIILGEESKAISRDSPLSVGLLRKLVVAQPALQTTLPLYLDHLAQLLERVPTRSAPATEQIETTTPTDQPNSPSIEDEMAGEVERTYARRLATPLKG
jgi:polyhydroxyalkanoate synthesis repressor PhaR